MKTPKVPEQMNKPNGFLSLIIIVLIISGVVTFFYPLSTTTQAQETSITEIQDMYHQNALNKITLEGNKLIAENKNGTKYKTFMPLDNSLKDLGFDLGANKTPVEVKDTATEKFVMNILGSIIPFLLVAAVIFFVFRQAQGSANSAFSFGQSKARLHDKDKNKTTFADVAGAAEVKEDLADIVDFLKNPKKYTKMGAKIPKGVLLYGSPGTGKTLLARAVAGEADVPFFSISGSEFVEMFVGVGASRVRDLFKKAKRSAPAIIFIDEIDAVGRQRGAGMGGGHDEREQTLNQILTEMDGFEMDTNVIVMAATNRPDILDPALLRPGRFDRRVTIDRPNVIEREQILHVHAKKKPLASDVDLKLLSRKLPGFTGADLENLLNESAILAAKKNQKEITMSDIIASIDKVTIGPEKKSRVLNDKERTITAYHELGHAVVGHLLAHCDPVHKVSVISRGMALGVTQFLPVEDVHLQSKIKFEHEICSLLGGRVAEEVFFGAEHITTGASNDLERASSIARKMVTEFGMSPAIGPVVLETHKSVFLGRDMGEKELYSDETARLVDAEMKRILTSCFDETKRIITEQKNLMDTIAEALLKKEELAEDEFKKFFIDAHVSVPEKA